MGKASTKHFNQRKIPLPSFPLGIHWEEPPETIADGALADAKNAEYNHVSGALRTVPGVQITTDVGEDGLIYGDNTNIFSDANTLIYTWGIVVKSLYRDYLHDTYLFSDATKLYKTDLISVTEIGTLSGQEKPCYTPFGDVVLIASGGKIQSYNGLTLTTIETSPNCLFVYDRQGRALVFGTTDRITYSGVGDYTNWTENTASDSVWLDIGYKDSGNIVAVDVLADSLIVYKSSGRAYQVSGEYDTWVVKELSRKADCINRHCALSVGNNAFFFGNDGFKSLATVVEYGDFKQIDAGLAINSHLSVDSTAQMWLVEPKKQIWIKPQNSERVFIYHYVTGSFTYRDFKYVLTDVVTVGDDVYMSYGNKIGRLNEGSDKDDDLQIVTVIKSKRYLPQKLYTILKYTKFQAQNLVAGSGLLEIGETKIGIIFNSASEEIYGNSSPIFDNNAPIFSSSFTNISEYGGGSNEELQAVLTIIGAAEVRSLDLEVAEV